MEVEISREEFKDWKENKVTQQVYIEIKELQDQWLQYIANGNTIGQEPYYPTEYVVGRIQALNDILLMDLRSE